MGLFTRSSAPTNVSPADAAAGLKAGDLVLVDVREPSEYRESHVRGSRPIPLGQLHGALAELAASDRPVAFVCRSGARSSKAAKLAAGAGVDARNVSGGMIAWQSTGAPGVKRG